MYDTVTPESIKSEIFSGITKFNTDEGSFADTIIAPTAYKIFEAYSQFRVLLDIFFIETSDDEYVVRRCADYGIERDMGSKAAVTLTLSGTDGAVIPAGTIFGTDDGLDFITTEDAEIISGAAQVQAEAEKVGALYNVAAGTVTKIITLVAGVSAVTNSAAATGGADMESIETLKAKWKKRFQSLPGSGNEAFYEVLAEEIPGVASAKAQGCWNGAGTVRVILRGEHNSVVDSGVTDAVSAYIEENKPFDATVTVVSVEAVTIGIEATVTLEDGILLADIKNEFESKVSDYFSKFDGSKVYITKIAELLSACDGVVTFSGIELNGAASDIEIAVTQAPALGSVSLTEGA